MATRAKRSTRRRNLLMAFGPGALAGRPEGWIFVVCCCLGVALISISDIRYASHGSVGALAFIPVILAGWLLSRVQTAVVTLVTMALRMAPMAAASIPVVTGVTQGLTVPVLAVLAQLAAEFVLLANSSEMRLERARAEGDRIAALEQAKSDFLRLASHELRGPLGVVRGYASMLEDGTLGELPDEANAIMPIVSSKVKAMGMMVDLMMETARLDDERLQLRKEPTDLGELVRECAGEMRSVAGPTHPIVVEAAPEPIVATADRSRIATIVNNLIDNAIKYSPAGGRVSCRVNPSDGGAIIAVSDQGIGIPKEDQGRLFARFSRVHTEDAPEIPGTGLGLYVSRELARLHGGDIRVESAAGRGSTFLVELPVRN
ncbi:MAG TPA: HAMP domain-containing sensor histidine kinase [Candidatus Dormibacteraeota bacterium]